MSQYAEQYASVLEEQKQVAAERQGVLSEAGAHLIDHPELLTAAETAETAEREAALSEQYAATESLRDRIKTIEKRLAKLQERETTLRAELRELSQDLDPIYAEIGRIAFDVYRMNPLVDQEYANLFSPLVEVHSEISGIDASIAEQQALLDDKPFLEKMVIRGKIALLKNRRATREGTLRRLIRGAGRDVMRTAFVDEIADPALTEAAEPFRDRMKQTRDREDELDTLEEQRVSLRKELAELGVEKRPAKRIKELDEELAVLDAEREAVRATLAANVLSRSPDGLPQEVTLLFSQATNLAERLDQLNATAARLEAALNVERLEREAEMVKSELNRKEQRQAEIKREITAIKKRVKEIDEELEASRSAMGPADELLNDA